MNECGGIQKKEVMVLKGHVTYLPEITKSIGPGEWSPGQNLN